MAFVYSDIEEAVRQALLTEFDERLSDDRCKSGDIDAVFQKISEGAPEEITDAPEYLSGKPNIEIC